MIFEGADGRDDHHRLRAKARFAAFDVDEFLGAEIGAKARLGHYIIGEFKRGLGGEDGIAAMRDIGERPAVNERRVVFESLHKVRLEGAFQKHRHGAMGVQIGRMNRLLVARVANHDPSQPVLQILDRGGKTKDGHDFGGDHDVEAILAGIAVPNAAQPNGDLPQRPVVHVDHALPCDAPHIEAQLIAVMDMIVDHRGEKIVGKTDRTEVAGKMEVDVLHRNNLRVTAPSRAALHAKNRAERGLAQTNGSILANPVQRIAEANRGGRLAFSSRGRADRRHENQLAVRPVLEAIHIIQRYLGLVIAKRLKVLIRDAKFFERHFTDAAHCSLLRDFDVRRHGPSSRSRVQASTTFCGLPAANASMLSMSWSARICMASRLAQATCGVMMKFGSRKSSRILPCLGGSTVSQSKPAPPMILLVSASAKACSSTSPPRPVLIRMASSFISWNSRAPIMFLVSGVNGKCRVMMSLSRSKVSRPVRPGCGKMS